MMQLPPYLNPGDRVGIAAPARWVDKNDMDFFLKALGNEEWEAVPGSIYSRHHQYSGSDVDRLVDFLGTLTDEVFVPRTPDAVPSGLKVNRATPTTAPPSPWWPYTSSTVKNTSRQFNGPAIT